MSSVGQAAGYIVGGIVGAFIPGGYVMLGAAIGGMIGGYLDPPKGPKIEGPRLSDLSQQAASYGSPIPRIYGACAMYGNVFWIENNALREHSATESAGGKGGGGQETTTYSYTSTFALGLCEGEVDAISRIWINGKLYFSGSASDPGTIVASNETSSTFAFYNGSMSQGADPRMQAALGVANTPAYRGLCYLVFYDLPMADYGNTLAAAQIKVELFKTATSSDSVTYNTLPNATSWSDITYGDLTKGHGFVAVQQTGTVAYSQDGVTWIACAMPSSTGWIKVVYGNGIYMALRNDVFHCAISRDGKNWVLGGSGGTAQQWSAIVFTGTEFLVFNTTNKYFIRSVDGAAWTSLLSNELYRDSVQWCSGATDNAGTTVIISAAGPSAGLYRCAAFQNGVKTGEGSMPDEIWTDLATDGNIFIACGYDLLSGPGWVAINSDGSGLVWTAVRLPVQPVTNAFPHGIAYSGGIWVISSYDQSGNSGAIFKSEDSGATWTTVFLPGTHGPKVIATDGAYFVTAGISTTTSMRMRFNEVSASAVALSSVVTEEAIKSKLLSSGDIVTTSLIDLVHGYRISEVSAIRSSIEPLRGAWPFDVVPSGYQIKFVRRGSLSSVATISADELGAVAGGSEPVVRMTKSREMDSQLPQRVTLTYLDAGRDYDLNEQYAERLNTDAVNVVALDMAIVMSADFAAQRAETLLYVYWLERHDISFNLPPSYAHLEPADVVTVVTSDGTYSLRLTEINYLPSGILECSAKFNDNAVYTSTAVGVTGTVAPSVIPNAVASVLELLDIPLLADDFNKAGFPVAMAGYISGWPGGGLYRSPDAGATWVLTNSFVDQSTIGYAGAPLAAPFNTTTIDAAGQLTVWIYGGKTLSSVPQLQMLNGANHFAYGRNGAWEIIAVQNCSLQADGSYILSGGMLRGRFGTEWAVGLHAVGDSIVLLDTQTLQFLAANTNQIGIPFIYRAVTSGKQIDSASDKKLTYRAINLECLSPVYLNGSRHPSTRDWTLNWIRRTRIGGEWRDMVDAPLGESSEAYEIDIFADGTYATVKRTVTATTPTATYSSANQITDFGSNQATIYVRIYQMSAVAGRGYPLQTSITRG